MERTGKFRFCSNYSGVGAILGQRSRAASTQIIAIGIRTLVRLIVVDNTVSEPALVRPTSVYSRIGSNCRVGGGRLIQPASRFEGEISSDNTGRNPSQVKTAPVPG